MTYFQRCKQIALDMLKDGWPRLVHPCEDGTYAWVYRDELIWRLKGNEGNDPPALEPLGYGWFKKTLGYE